MHSRRRLVLAVATGIAIGLTLLVALEAVQNYPSSDGISLRDGELLGGDFVAFYVGGRLFLSDRDRLYDLEYQRELRADLFGPPGASPAAELPFVYPPLVAALASPFSRLPFQRAFLLWTLFGILVSVASLALLMKSSGATGVIPLPLLLLFSFGFVPFSMNTILGGQLSWFGMGILAAVSLAILHRHDYLAGVVVSLSYYKPPLFLFLLFVLLLARGWKFILGFATGALILMAGTFLLVGIDGLSSYIDAATRFLYGQEVYHGMEVPRGEGIGLPALGFSLCESFPKTIAILSLPTAALACLGYRLLAGREGSETLLGLILISSTSVALSVYVLKYDLALLLIPMVLAVAWFGRGRGPERALILLAFVGFYFEFPLRHFTIGEKVLNASSLLLVTLLAVLTWQGWRVMREEGSSGAASDWAASSSG